MAFNTLTEHFEDKRLDIVVLGNERWLKGGQIGAALGFADPEDAVRKILRRSIAEFDDNTTMVIEMPTAGGRQLVRLYNARGAALIAMKAQTPKGEDFRRWVLDVLEGRDDNTPIAAGANIPAGVLSSLRVLFLGARGNTQIVRYLGLDLGTSEIARLLGVTPHSVTARRRMAEFLGLVTAPATLEAQRLTPNYLKMVEGRKRARSAYDARRQQLALTAPEAGDSDNG